MTERGTQNPLHHLGERLFGHGRKFGIQMGSLEQQLLDPYTRCSDVVRRYWGNFAANDIESWQLNYALNLLTRRVNDGTADDKLIPSMEGIVLRATPDHTPNHTSNHINVDRLSDYQNFLDDEKSIFHLYRHLISKTETPESIPYLLQALNSSFVVRGNEPVKRDPETLLHTDDAYDTYGIVEYWNVYYPFANQARVRLHEINARIQNPQKSKEIGEAVARFDAVKKRETTTTAQVRRRHTIVSPLNPA